MLPQCIDSRTPPPPPPNLHKILKRPPMFSTPMGIPVAIPSALPDAVEYLWHLVNHLSPGTYLPENSHSIVSHFIFMKKYFLEKILS